MIRVLIVDDSLFMRRLVTDMLQSDPAIGAVDTAKDGFEAIKKIPKFRPDVITLDLAMPGLDGPATLREIMSLYPTPVVLLSAYSREGADVTFECLAAGAVGFVPKPSGELSLDIEKIHTELLKEIKAAASCAMRRRAHVTGRGSRHRQSLVVIGASTGGPQTLEIVLSSLPPRFLAPIVIVQHMPTRLFTQPLAKRLDQRCSLHVREAVHGELLKEGHAYLIPAGMRADVNASIHLVEAPNVVEEGEIVTPSIDGTMQSAAACYREGTVGVILTGMGKDGVEGVRAIRAQGGRTIVEDKSALIFGMPRKVIEEGLADEILPADEIGAEIIRSVSLFRDNLGKSSDEDRNDAKN